MDKTTHASRSGGGTEAQLSNVALLYSDKGLTQGETIMAVADALPRNPVADVDVCQLVGSMISTRTCASEYCTIQISGKLGARSFMLHAPARISDTGLAERPDDLKSAKKRFPIVCGRDRRQATLGAIRGGFVSHLCGDTALGNALLDD